MGVRSYWYIGCAEQIQLSASTARLIEFAQVPSESTRNSVTIALFTARVSRLRAQIISSPAESNTNYFSRPHSSVILFLRNVIPNEKKCNNTLDGNNFIISPTADVVVLQADIFWPAWFGGRSFYRRRILSHLLTLRWTMRMSQTHSWVTHWPLGDKAGAKMFLGERWIPFRVNGNFGIECECAKF